MNWTTIDEAPTDGREVLLGFFRDLENISNNPPPLVAAWHTRGGYWYLIGVEGNPEIETDPGPTHYMPLPSPPVS